MIGAILSLILVTLYYMHLSRTVCVTWLSNAALYIQIKHNLANLSGIANSHVSLSLTTKSTEECIHISSEWDRFMVRTCHKNVI